MDGMNMGGMGTGMDMSSSGMFLPTNMAVARAIWYLVAGAVALLAARRVIEKVRSRITLAKFHRHPSTIPSRPENLLSTIYATSIALCREIAYPQIFWLSGPYSKYFNPPALGRCLLLLAYWAVILTALWTNTILTPSSPNYAYKWEIVGFRAAWVSVTQLPLIYLLGSKINLVTLITGISYERLNWLHRWIARTLFLTVIVHWSFFFREWWIADFVSLELQMMTMVKYGFGSWAVLGWMVLTGFGFVRSLSYEFFLLQHLLSFSVLLWLVHGHVPSYAQYNVWLAISFVALDHVGRYMAILVQNLHLGIKSAREPQKYAFGFSVLAQRSPDDHVVLTIKNFDVSIGPGQHIYLSIPRCGLFQWHPFSVVKMPGSNDAKIIIKAHAGFSRKLQERVSQHPQQDLRALFSLLFGSPPLDIVERSDSMILMATSTGASFTVPVLQHVANRRTGIRRICFYWIVRDPEHFTWFASDITPALEKAQSSGIQVRARIYVTRGGPVHASSSAHEADGSLHPSQDHESKQDSEECSSERFALLPIDEKVADGSKSKIIRQESSSETLTTPWSRGSLTNSRLALLSGRPFSLDSLIRPTIEDSEGETAILACGNPAFMAQIRTYTAALSDERAVHKGTGAQGIFVFTETYGW